MKISILSFYSGQVERGVETWASEVQKRLPQVEIISGKSAIESFKDWSSADIVIPTNGRFQVLVCRIGTWVKGKPMIVFGHAGRGADDKWNLLCSPNVFVAFTKTQQKWAEKYKLPWTKVLLIPHAVDTSRFVSAKKPRQRIILCVAANIPSKRVHLVKSAVEKLKGFKLHTIGEGNSVQAAFSDMPNIYQKADVFCFVPWEAEAFGLVFLEALATNLPVVTINDPIRREIVGEAGVFVDDPENVNSLANVIKDAYETKWGDKPRKQALKFSWDKIIKKYENLFVSYHNH